MNTGGLAAPIADANNGATGTHASMLAFASPLTINNAQALNYQKKKALQVRALIAGLQ